ncbi:hypothetical protein IWX90DRAFT_122299 [Phyllosticta citrichinensis]|uniref:Uncharacterized protein n=1 Tax=Phyllosticta citrichinensis TaxID=1130410 RepID=A0ABR1Y455_9PEZI
MIEVDKTSPPHFAKMPIDPHHDGTREKSVVLLACCGPPFPITLHALGFFVSKLLYHYFKQEREEKRMEIKRPHRSSCACRRLPARETKCRTLSSLLVGLADNQAVWFSLVVQGIGLVKSSLGPRSGLAPVFALAHAPGGQQSGPSNTQSGYDRRPNCPCSDPTNPMRATMAKSVIWNQDDATLPPTSGMHAGPARQLSSVSSNVTVLAKTNLDCSARMAQDCRCLFLSQLSYTYEYTLLMMMMMMMSWIATRGRVHGLPVPVPAPGARELTP